MRERAQEIQRQPPLYRFRSQGVVDLIRAQQIQLGPSKFNQDSSFSGGCINESLRFDKTEIVSCEPYTGTKSVQEPSFRI